MHVRQHIICTILKKACRERKTGDGSACASSGGQASAPGARNRHARTANTSQQPCVARPLHQAHVSATSPASCGTYDDVDVGPHGNQEDQAQREERAVDQRADLRKSTATQQGQTAFSFNTSGAAQRPLWNLLKKRVGAARRRGDGARGCASLSRSFVGRGDGARGCTCTLSLARSLVGR